MIWLTYFFCYEDAWRVTYNYNCVERHPFVLPNRHIEGLRSLDSRSTKPNAFILGSSVSHAFQCSDWEVFLPDSARAFHFPGLGESLFAIKEKAIFLNEHYDIAHLLLVLDSDILLTTTNRNTPFQILPPPLGQASVFQFWTEIIGYSLDGMFIAAYVDYTLNGVFRPYMKNRLMNWGDEPSLVDCETNDEWSPELKLKSDSVGFFSQKIQSGAIPEVYTADVLNKLPIKSIGQLCYIDSILPPDCTLDIIIPPSLGRLQLSRTCINQIKDCIPRAEISNYSFLGPERGYFYDAVHFRPLLARELLATHYLDEEPAIVPENYEREH